MKTTSHRHITYPCPFCDRRLGTDQVSNKSAPAAECCRRGDALRRIVMNSYQWPNVYPSWPQYDDILNDYLLREGLSCIDSEWFSDSRGVELLQWLEEEIHASIGERRPLDVGENPYVHRIADAVELLNVIRLLTDQRPRFDEEVFYHPACWARMTCPRDESRVFSVDSGLMEPKRFDGELQIASPRWNFVLVGDDVIRSGESMALALQENGVSSEPADLQLLLDAGLRDHLRRSAKPGYWMPTKVGVKYVARVSDHAK